MSYSLTELDNHIAELRARLEEARLWNQFAKFLEPHDPGRWTQDRVTDLKRQIAEAEAQKNSHER